MNKCKLFVVSVLTVFLTACCNQVKEESSVMTEQTDVGVSNSDSSEISPTIFAVGDSYTFPEEDTINGGLKITVESVVVDKSIDLNSDSSSRNIDGLVPIVVTATFENTTNQYVDIGAFELLDKDGNMGHWIPYLEGVSVGSTSGLNSGQKMKIVEVFGSPSEKGFDLTYAYATWRID